MGFYAAVLVVPIFSNSDLILNKCCRNYVFGPKILIIYARKYCSVTTSKYIETAIGVYSSNLSRKLAMIKFNGNEENKFTFQNMRNPRAVTKRPSRKHRRRPSNLLKEYLRRQRRKKWLETHIWHAKRFHMTEKWGYKLALHPNDKSARASYRASVKHCLLQVNQQ